MDLLRANRNLEVDSLVFRLAAGENRCLHVERFSCPSGDAASASLSSWGSAAFSAFGTLASKAQETASSVNLHLGPLKTSCSSDISEHAQRGGSRNAWLDGGSVGDVAGREGKDGGQHSTGEGVQID